MPTGTLSRLHASIAPAASTAQSMVSYDWPIGAERLPIQELIGRGIQICWTGRIRCSACGKPTRKSYGQGYCYPCFSTLARCDLCIVSPSRCHYHLGTCREPEWADGFCMQPHVVYLANSSGAKVGITGANRHLGRWADQGAAQGLVVATTPTRRDAGLLEAWLAQYVPDRTDWRQMVVNDAPPLALAELAATLQEKIRNRNQQSGADPIADYVWQPETLVELSYPVARYGAAQRLVLNAPQATVSGELIGIKGQFLLFPGGVFNVAQHAGWEVTVTVVGAHAVPSTDEQLRLF